MGMTRQRAIPPDLFSSEELIGLPIEARFMLVGLYLHADDEGREKVTPWKIKASIWPGNPEITEDLIIEFLLLLDETEWLDIYSVGPLTLYTLPIFPTPSRPSKSRLPAPPERRSSDGAATESLMAWERERAREREAPDGLPPSPFCSEHQPAGDKDPCRQCGTARLWHEQWLRMRRAERSSEREGDE